MPETFQNLDDVQQSNPLVPNTITDLDSTDITPTKKTFKMPKDPKIILLAVLGIFILILLLLSIVVSISKSSTKKPTSIAPATTITPVQSTISPEKTLLIPTAFKQRFDDLENAVQETVDFPLPQSDPSIGITPDQ